MMNNKDVCDFYNHKFDFNNQHKDTYDDWLEAYSNAISKRAVHGCFMGMSSGYDSGATSYELTRQGIKFKAYINLNNENIEIIKKRTKYLKDYEISNGMDAKTWKKYYDFLNGKINKKAMEDTASMGVAQTFELAKKEGRKIFICGQGGDEIISDYALYPGQSTFKGMFPTELYEWPNFRENMQREYIQEIEDIAKIYDIEVRYVYLDIDLVQEFLWLKADLKNAHYKAPLYEYLTRNNVPFEQNVKRGFNPINKDEAAKEIKRT